MNLKDKKILIFGGSGMLGLSLQKRLEELNYSFFAPTHNQCNVVDDISVRDAFEDYGPDIVINVFCSFAGIVNNSKSPYSIFDDNLQGNLNIIRRCIRPGVPKLIQISSQCIYGDNAPVPFKEEDAWNFGLPTENNSGYGIGKRVLHLALESAKKEFELNSVVLIPSNMYGPGDNFHKEHTHVIPALIRRLIEAKENKLESVEIYGTGLSTREFLYVDDCANAILLAAEKYDSVEPVNIGTGREVSIKYLARTISDIVGYEGKLIYNQNGLDGQARRVSNVEKAKERFGFVAETTLEKGLEKTIKYFKENRSNLRERVYYD